MGSVHQYDATWLLDPRLVDARVHWHERLLNIARISDHIAELQAMWKNLSWIIQEKTLLGQVAGLLQTRRDCAAASEDLRGMLTRAESELVNRWHGFMKKVGVMLNTQKCDARTIAPAATREG